MEKLPEVRATMLDEIAQIDGGWESLSKKTGLSVTFLRKILKNDNDSTPRISTLEKIKAGIKECLAEDEARIGQLLV